MKKVKKLCIFICGLLLIFHTLAAETGNNVIGTKVFTVQPIIPDLTANKGLVVDNSIAALTIESPPTGIIYAPPEYGPVYGPLLTWGVFTELVVPFVVGVTAGDTDSIATVMVYDESSKTDAINALSAAAADLDRIKFIQYNFDTNWVRDYGPRFIRVNNKQAMIDMNYFRANDDAAPSFLGDYWQQDVYHLDLYMQGGNFLCFSNGDAFATRIIVNDNPEKTEQEIIDLFRSYMNVNLTFFDPLPPGVDATNHIDMWFTPIDDYRVVIGQFDPSAPGYAETEAAAGIMRSRGYTVYRVPNYNNGYGGTDGIHYTYTNCAILNNKVFLPRYNRPLADDEALRVFREALPGHQVISLDMTDIIQYYGALHCTMQHIYTAADTYVEVISPNGGQGHVTGDTVAIKWIALDDEQITSIDIAYSTNGGTQYNTIASNEMHDRAYSWTVPRVDSTNCLIRITARDADNNTATDISDAPFTIRSRRSQSPSPTRTPTFTRTPTTTPSGSNVKGDVNSDQLITIVDALMVAQYYVGLTPVNFNASAADVDENGAVNIIDALMIAQYYVGLISF